MATSESRDVPLHGANARGTCGMVNSTGFCWVNFPPTISFDYKNIPGAGTERLYLWRDLGRGSKGRAFLACNSTGKAYAVKFFLIDYDTFHRSEETVEDRATRRAAEMARKKAEAEKERDYWLQVYGDTFRNQVRVIQLNNLWCLMMPYFDQVLNHEREGCLDQIKVHLTSFKEKNLLYRKEDLRWRHIGVRDGSVYIFDLGSLTPTNDEIDVDEQIRKLRAKIND